MDTYDAGILDDRLAGYLPDYIGFLASRNEHQHGAHSPINAPISGDIPLFSFTSLYVKIENA
jgi:hypothetical protein